MSTLHTLEKPHVNNCYRSSFRLKGQGGTITAFIKRSLLKNNKLFVSHISTRDRMKFAIGIVLVVLIVLTNNVYGLENLIGSEIQKCLNCLCHARSGCWSRFNCARYSISKDYWIKAGSHSLGDVSDTEKAFHGCMENENCILNTIKTYTERFGERDCNCDGAFDCKDRLAIHLFGDACFNPKYGDIFARRFNDCAKSIGVHRMSSIEGDCTPEVF